MASEKIAFLAASNPAAQSALTNLTKRYGQSSIDNSDAIVALGGDGFMLETLHGLVGQHRPIYGMNRGTIGFLMNAYDEDDLPKKLASAQKVALRPLLLQATTMDGEMHEALAINEVSLHRESRQAARLKISVDGVERLDQLICDGILVATPAGSTAYNLSAHGPIIPLGANILALTPVSAFRPRRWRGALLNHKAVIEVEILEPEKRPVSAEADYTDIPRIRKATIRENRKIAFRLLFDPEHNLEQRILAEQFLS